MDNSSVPKDDVQDRLDAVEERLALLEDKCGIGLWEAVLFEGDAFHERSEWIWSPEFRRLVGFETELEFPNVVGSWFDRLHPDDVDTTVAAFAGHLEDKTGRTQYDVTYRMRVRDGTYKYFRATGGCRWAADGIHVRTCGSLIPVDDQVRLREEAERNKAEDEQVQAKIFAGLEALAHGNLTFRISDDIPAKGQALKTHFNEAVARLGSTMSNIVTIAGAMRGGSTDITKLISDLSNRTNSQAAALEKSAAAMLQMTTSVQQSADAAAQTADITMQAREAAEGSAKVVERAVSAMDEIDQSADEISRIVRIIDEIAFQINLLALNASVEAARAGEVGRGFTVVAHEVRELAGRTATAASDIKTLIEKSSGQVKGGVKLVGETGEALQGIIEQVISISGYVDSIATSSKEQSSGLADISTSISSMDQMTQENARMADASSAAAKALDDHVSDLSTMTGAFELADGASEPARRVA